MAFALCTGGFGWLLFIALVVSVFLLQRGPRRPQARDSAPDTQLTALVLFSMTAFATGVVCWAMAFVMISALRRLEVRRLHGQLTFTFDQHGLTQCSPGHTTAHRWAQFRAFEEGPDVFVLRTDADTGIIVPKRRFASGDDCDRVRKLFRERIVHQAVPVALGFPVIPP